MYVKFNNAISNPKPLIGGGPQGTILGQILYISSSNDCSINDVTSDRYKYIDDISILEIISLAGILKEYNFLEHIPSDIATDQLFLHPSNLKTQDRLENITAWTDENKSKLNETKSYYIIFSRCKEQFSTRLTMNNTNLQRLSVTKVLGVWFDEDLT